MLGAGFNAAAFGSDSKLCIIGVCETAVGPVPFSHVILVDGIPDGPVDLLADDIQPMLDESKGPIMSAVKQGALESAVADLVTRARQGDQNAMAMLQETKESADKGSEQAKRAVVAVHRYIFSHPVVPGKTSAMGLELPSPKTDQAVRALAKNISTANPAQYASVVLAIIPSIASSSIPRAYVTLANGPDVYDASTPFVKGINDALMTAEEQTAFQFGLIHSADEANIYKATSGAKMTPAMLKALQIGYVLGCARRVQGIRRPDVPISLLSPMAAWELGE